MEDKILEYGLLQYPCVQQDKVKSYGRPYIDGYIFVNQATEEITFGDTYQDSRPLDLGSCFYNLGIY